MFNTSKSKYVLIFILVVIVILSSIPTIFKCNNRKEGFLITQELYKRYCPSCGHKSQSGCSKCMNCGWCVNASGHGECVPGDSYGPYFKNCMYWNFGKSFNPYSILSPSINDLNKRRLSRRHKWRNWWQYRKPGRYRYYYKTMYT